MGDGFEEDAEDCFEDGMEDDFAEETLLMALASCGRGLRVAGLLPPKLEAWGFA